VYENSLSVAVALVVLDEPPADYSGTYPTSAIEAFIVRRLAGHVLVAGHRAEWLTDVLG
jgi:hypothetical protein